jgi:opacity protein-like surface antigen
MVRRLTISFLAGLAPLAFSVAHAADYPQPMPPPPVYVAPPVEEFGSSWYLRGDIGFSNQQVDSIWNSSYGGFSSVQNVDKGFDAAPFFGLGIGYNVNEWLRFDVTGEYRAKANFHGFDVGRLPDASCNSGPPCYASDRYTGSKSEWLFLLNGYVDLGTWSNFTPFVGAGVGVSRNTISNFGDFSTCVDSSSCAATGGSDAYASSASKWQFAWALYAGIGYRITKNTTLEFAYRYVNLGNAESGDLTAFDGTNNVNNPMEFRRLSSHDLKFGVRMNFDAFNGFDSRPAYYAPPPVYAPPPPVYQPAPVYPPLRSRG